VLITKQKSNIESWIDNRDNLIEDVPYDGPDDIDRYLGHEEFDDDSGYYLCD
ncbi:1288_t:CDS:1, partial [Funneliformis mosseae]